MGDILDDLYMELTWGSFEKTKKIIESGVDPNVVLGQTGRPAIYRGINFGMITAIEYLISKGASVNIIDQYGDTPLLYAVEYAYPDICRLLLKRGADPNILDENGLSCLDRIKEYTPKKTYRALVPVFIEYEHLLNDEEKKKLKKLKPKKK